MRNRISFSLFDLFSSLFLFSIILGLILPFWSITINAHSKATTKSAAKSIGLTMITYAESDIKNFKMPYPLPQGKEKVWGNSKYCWSTSVAEMLFKQKYFKKGEEAQLKSAGVVDSAQYKAMMLNDFTIHKDTYWSKGTELDFHLYCEKGLTSKVEGKLVLVATYDNESIKDCQFQGKGWYVFFADKTAEFIKRKKLDEYVDPIVSVNYIEGTKLDKSIQIRKRIPISEGGPGTFGNGFGGGSTELMGKKETDAVFKALVDVSLK